MIKFKNFIRKGRSTLLCVGPMSKNCIDASIEISKQYAIPMIMIASRRQIDAGIFGGGYVENFTTSRFVRYIRSFKAPHIFIGRDHGGPWQSTVESSKKMNVHEAMISAKRSFEADITSGFNFIHIDPSIPINNEKLDDDTILDRMFDLYDFCDACARRNNKVIEYEIGTEEQKGNLQDREKLCYMIDKTIAFCKKNKIKKPAFFVAQTGTKVAETRNTGIFCTKDLSSLRPSLAHIKTISDDCHKRGVMLKEHNADYLPNEALGLRPLLGIDASNIAPDFGVTETRALLYILSVYGFKDEFNYFVEASFNSRKWQKWMIKNSTATKFEKAVISGHYIFADPAIKRLKSKVSKKLIKKGLSLDNYLKTAVKKSMFKYLSLFRNM